MSNRRFVVARRGDARGQSGGLPVRDRCIPEELAIDLVIAAPTTDSRTCGIKVPDGLKIEIADGATLSIAAEL